MIAVVAPDCEREFVNEFFELFKTPWEFFRKGRSYDVALVAARDADRLECNAKIFVVYGSERTPFDEQSQIPSFAVQKGVWIRYPQGRIPVYGDCMTYGTDGFGLVDELHGRSVGHISSRDGKVWIRLGYDLFHEVNYSLSCGQPSQNSATPSVDRHIAVLRAIIVGCGVPLVEIPPLPDGYNFIVCLTHDVDHPAVRLHKLDRTAIGFAYRAVIGSVVNILRGRSSLSQLAHNWFSVFKLPFVYLGFVRDFWDTFYHYIVLETGLGATYYFIPKRATPGRILNGKVQTMRGAAYNLADVAEQIRRLRLAGCEVGVHGVDAWSDSASASEERNLVSVAIGEQAYGVRMHWLYFTPDSPSVLEAAGFGYDSTFGYNETVGFRAGTIQVFKPRGATTLLELPLHIMDTALFYPAHMNLSFGAAKHVVLQLIEEARNSGGALTINWHDRSIAPERLWDGFYAWLIGELKQRVAWFSTAADAVKWFRMRRSATFDQISWDGHSLRARIRVAEADKVSPGLVLRVHKPHPQRIGNLWTWDSSAAHIDIGIHDAADIRLLV